MTKKSINYERKLRGSLIKSNNFAELQLAYEKLSDTFLSLIYIVASYMITREFVNTT